MAGQISCQSALYSSHPVFALNLAKARFKLVARRECKVSLHADRGTHSVGTKPKLFRAKVLVGTASMWHLDFVTAFDLLPSALHFSAHFNSGHPSSILGNDTIFQRLQTSGLSHGAGPLPYPSQLYLALVGFWRAVTSSPPPSPAGKGRTQSEHAALYRNQRAASKHAGT